MGISAFPNLLWQWLCLVPSVVTQSSLDTIQRVSLCRGPMARAELALSCPKSLSLEQKTATIQTIAVEMSAIHSGVSTSDPSALHRTLRFTSAENVFRAHQSVSVPSLQAWFCCRVLCSETFSYFLTFLLSEASVSPLDSFSEDNWVAVVWVWQPPDDAFMLRPLMNIDLVFSVLAGSLCCCICACIHSQTDWTL